MKVIAILFFFLGLNVSLAQITEINQTFGTAGKVLTDVGLSSYAIQATAIDGAGKIVAAGFAYSAPSSGVQVLTLVRYNLDGSLDASFGSGGVVRGSQDEGYTDSPVRKMSMIILNDGKIVVAHGNRYGPYENAIINKFNSNGSFDASFGINGSVKSIAGFKFASAIAATSDDKLIVGGYKVSGTLNKCILARMNTNGTIDSSFGINGFVVVNTLNNSYSYAHDIKIRNGSSILIGISNYQSVTDGKFVFAQLNGDGTVDSNFGTNGLTETTFSASTQIKDFSLSQDNKIIACSSISGAIIMARYDATGILDPTFGIGGIVYYTHPIYNYSTCNSMTLLNDGKIITSGTTPPVTNSAYKYNLLRFNNDGSIDSTFGVDAIILDDMDASSTTFFSTSSLKSYGNKLYLAGNNYSPYGVYAIARYNIDSNLSSADFTKEVRTFSASPNPFTTIINIVFELSTKENLSVDLYDSNGREIQNLIQDKIFSVGKNSVEIQMPESLANGIYFVRVFNGSINTTLKIIK